MLQAGEVINTDVGPDGGVALAIGGGVNERGGASPIFVRSVGEEYFGNDLLADGTIE